MIQFPKAILSKEETMELIKLYQETGNQEALEKLVLYNGRLVTSMVTRYIKKDDPSLFEDLVSIGTIGLIKSIKKFDFNYDVNFSTYAVPSIIGEIHRFFRDDGLIKVSRSIRATLTKIRAFEKEFMLSNQKEPSFQDIADALGIPIEEVIVAIKSNINVKSFDEIVFDDGGSDSITLGETLDLSFEERGYEYLPLYDSIDKLNEREKQIIRLRYWEDKVQTEVADILGISQVQVSRLEKRILEKIKNQMNEKDLPSVQPETKMETEKMIIQPKIIKEPVQIIELEEKRMEMEEMKKSKKEEVFASLDKGLKKETIMKKHDISKQSYYNYKSQWKKERQEAKINQHLDEKPIGEEIKLPPQIPAGFEVYNHQPRVADVAGSIKTDKDIDISEARKETRNERNERYNAAKDFQLLSKKAVIYKDKAGKILGSKIITYSLYEGKLIIESEELGMEIVEEVI